MIQAVDLCFNHRLRVKAGPRLEFAPGLNVIVGANGAGKSTLLRALHGCPHCVVHRDPDSRTLVADTEGGNPRVRAFAGKRTFADAVLQVRARFSSHGQALRDLFKTLDFEAGDTLLVDEPESGQDLANLLGLRQAFDGICRLGVQAIVASHHPAFWRGARLLPLGDPAYVAASLARWAEVLRAAEPPTP